MKSKSGFTLIEIMIVVVIFGVILGIVPYGMNIYKFCTSDFDAPYKREIVHGIGLVPPLGCVTGWINVEDGTNTVEVVK
jgi:prepilin-type N-terminal cleavage/methylation domain-containing protein